MRMVRCLTGGFLIAFCAAAQPRECPAVDIAPGSTTAGTIEATDCRLSEITRNNLLPVVYGKQHRLTLTERGVQRFEVTGAGFGPALYIFNDNFVLLANNGTGAAATAPNARVVIHLAPGAYRIVVAGRTAAAVGSFELKAVTDGLRNCPIEDVAAGAAAQGSFSETGCRFLDLSPGSTNENPVAFFRVPVARRGVLDVQVQSSLSTLATVLTPAQGTTPVFSGGASLTASLTANTYLIAVSTRAQFGPFSLQTRFDDLRTCAPVDLDPNSGVGGELAADDCRMLDLQVPSAVTIPADPYRLRVAQPSVVQLDLSSTSFDSLLRLWSANGTPITDNDDFSNSTVDSRILIHLPAATYQVLATAFRGSADPLPAGPYEMKAASEPPRKCDIPALALNQAVEGPFRTEGCRLLDLAVFEEEPAIVTPFALPAPRRSIVRIDMNVPGAAAELDLIHPTLGIVTAGFTDRAGNAAAELQLPSGDYTLALLSSTENPPPFTVRAALRDVPDCPATELTLGETVQGTISASDCRYLEIVPLVRPVTRSKLYRANAARAGRVTFELASDEFEPVLVVADSEMRPIAVAQRATPGTTALAGTLPAGVYNLIVTTARDNPGSFTLRTAFEPSGGPAPSSSARPEISSAQPDSHGDTEWMGPDLSEAAPGLRFAAKRKAVRRPDVPPARARK